MDFVFEVTTRKYKTLLGKELEKKEIQEGLIKACDVIDLIIEILRGSKSRDQVKKCLVEGITEGIRFKSKASEKAAKNLKFTELSHEFVIPHTKTTGRFYPAGSDGGDCYSWRPGKSGGA